MATRINIVYLEVVKNIDLKVLIIRKSLVTTWGNGC